MTAIKRVGLIGAGLMGHGIAQNILKGGCNLDVLEHAGNQPIDDLMSAGATTHTSIRALADSVDVIILCVTGSPQVEAILKGPDGLLSNWRGGCLLIDCSTAIPDSTLRLASLAKKAGIRFLDAPMTRTPKEAREGRLNLLVGGEKKDFQEALPLFNLYAENITHVGKTGSGHAMKLIHNYVSLGFSAVLAEAVATANQAGVDTVALQQVLDTGGGKGVVLDRMTPYILENDLSSYAFSLANSYKDIGYYVTMCSDLKAQAAVAEAVLQRFEQPVKDSQGHRYVPELIDMLTEE